MKKGDIVCLVDEHHIKGMILKAGDTAEIEIYWPDQGIITIGNNMENIRLSEEDSDAEIKVE